MKRREEEKEEGREAAREETGQKSEMFRERRKTARDEGDTIPDRKLMSFFGGYY